MTNDRLQGVEVFFGDANNAEARIYARLADQTFPSGAQLTGRVVGPSCAYAKTLPAAIRLAPKRAPQDSTATGLLSEAIVPDPCFWSAEMPFLYRVEVELQAAGQRLAAAERDLGIRPLGVRGRKLLLEGRPWVIRAVHASQLPDCALSAWREADVAMAVDDPDEALCREASRRGVWLTAWLSGPAERIEAELPRLSRWPCLALAVLDSKVELSASARAAAMNLPLAQRFGAGEPVAPAEWAAAAICEDDDSSRLAARAASCEKPVLALRRAGRFDDLTAARRICDELQRDLAGRGEFAGYMTRLQA